MRHHKSGRKFGRERKVRLGLMRGLAINLINEGKIKTTEAKAKELRPYVEKLLTLGKKNTVASRRVIASKLGGQSEVAARLVLTIAPKYKERAGGYTRITKLPVRVSDSARLALIEFI